MHYCEYQLTWKNGYNLPDAVKIYEHQSDREPATHIPSHTSAQERIFPKTTTKWHSICQTESKLVVSDLDIM